MTSTRTVLRRKRAAGFTLLEVLVAIAILGLGLTVVLSAQTGVFWSYSRAAHLSRVPSLVRCKMSEIELELLKEGYPLLDQNDDGPCCEDEYDDKYQCSWKIEQVELPELPTGALGDAGAGAPAGSFGAEGLGDVGGVLGKLEHLKDGDLRHHSGGTEELAGMMSGTGPGAMVSMAMSMVYPSLKPMLEASIRKVTVTIAWKEGVHERDLVVTQYLSSPLQGGFDPLAAEGMPDELPFPGGGMAGGGSQ